MKISKGFILCTLAALSWAIGIIITRYLLQSGENAYTVNFFINLAALAYWLPVFFRQRMSLKTLSIRGWSIMITMGLVSGLGVGIVKIFALKYSPAMNYSFLFRTVILFTIIFAYIFLKEPITKKKIILSIMMLAGGYLLTTSGKALSLTIGDIFTLTEAALVAFGNNVLGKMSARYMNSDIGAAGTNIIGFIGIFILSAFQHAIVFPHMLLMMLLLSASGIVVAQIRFKAYQLVSASFITMIFSFTPVFVSFMAVPLLGETLTPFQMVGGALVVIAGIFVEKLHI